MGFEGSSEGNFERVLKVLFIGEKGQGGKQFWRRVDRYWGRFDGDFCMTFTTSFTPFHNLFHTTENPSELPLQCADPHVLFTLSRKSLVPARSLFYQLDAWRFATLVVDGQVWSRSNQKRVVKVPPPQINLEAGRGHRRGAFYCASHWHQLAEVNRLRRRGAQKPRVHHARENPSHTHRVCLGILRSASQQILPLVRESF